MNTGKIISVRYSSDEIRKLEEGAAITGIKDISKYIRYKLFGRDNSHQDLEINELLGRIADMERSRVEMEADMKSIKAMMAVMIGLLKRRASSGEISDLRAELIHKDISPENMVTDFLPEFAEILSAL